MFYETIISIYCAIVHCTFCFIKALWQRELRGFVKLLMKPPAKPPMNFDDLMKTD